MICCSASLVTCWNGGIKSACRGQKTISTHDSTKRSHRSNIHFVRPINWNEQINIYCLAESRLLAIIMLHVAWSPFPIQRGTVTASESIRDSRAYIAPCVLSTIRVLEDAWRHLPTQRPTKSRSNCLQTRCTYRTTWDGNLHASIHEINFNLNIHILLCIHRFRESQSALPGCTFIRHKNIFYFIWWIDESKLQSSCAPKIISGWSDRIAYRNLIV